MDTLTSQMSDEPAGMSSPSIPPDIELFCMECDYCLTGLVDDRCPECGHPFDRHRLIEWTTQPNQPIPFGNTTGGRPPGLLSTSLFHAKRLGRQVPPHGNLKGLMARMSVWRTAVFAAMLVITVVPVWYQAGGTLDGTIIVAVAFAKLVGMLLGFMLAELAVAGLLAFLVAPRAVPKKTGRFRFWYALCLCFSTFSILSLVSFILLPWVLGLLIAAFSSGAGSSTLFLFYTGRFLPLLLLLWWWRNLGMAVAARAVGRSRTGLAICLIPIIGLIAFAIPLGAAMAFIVATMWPR